MPEPRYLTVRDGLQIYFETESRRAVFSCQDKLHPDQVAVEVDAWIENNPNHPRIPFAQEWIEAVEASKPQYDKESAEAAEFLKATGLDKTILAMHVSGALKYLTRFYKHLGLSDESIKREIMRVILWVNSTSRQETNRD